MAGFISRIGSAFNVLTGKTKGAADTFQAGTMKGESIFAGMGQREEAGDEALIAQYRSWVYIAANKNAVALAEHNPPRLFITTQEGQRKARCRTIDIDSSLRRAIKTAPSYKTLQVRAHVKAADEIEEVVEHPFLELMRNPNAMPGGPFVLWYLKSLYQDLTGRAYWWVPKDKLEMPSAIFNLPPQWVVEIRSKKDAERAGLRASTIKFPEEVSFKGVAYGADRQKRIFIPAAEVVPFKMPDPNNPLNGYGPTRSVLMTSIRDKAMDVYEAALNKNQGRPDMLISPKGDKVLTESERRMLQEDYNSMLSGVHQAGKALVASGQMDIVKMGYSPRDMQFQQGRPWARDQIANAFGVPPSLMKTEGVPRANLEAAMWQYIKFTIWPRMIHDMQILNEVLLPMFDQPNAERPVIVSNRLFVAYENPTPADREFTLRQQTEDLDRSVVTINEVRKERGLDPVEWGDVPLSHQRVESLERAPVQAAQDEPTKNIQRPSPAATKDSGAPGLISWQDDNGKTHHATKGYEIAVDADGMADVIRCGCCKHGTKEKLDLSENPTPEERNGGHVAPEDADEKELAGVVDDMYDSQRIAVLSQAPQAITIDNAWWAEKWSPKASPIIGRITAKAGDAQLTGVGLDITPWVKNPKVQDAIQKETFKFLEKTTDTVQKRFRKSLAEGLDAGESIPQLKRRLEDVFAGLKQQGNAEMIARTESARAQVKGKQAAMQDVGFTKQIWVESADACPFCLDAQSKYKDPQPIGHEYMPDGSIQEVAFGKDEDGTPKTIKLRHNYGPVIGPPLHPNCVTGDTLVFAPGIKHGFRAYYNGDLLEITLADSRRLSVTPNHMLLTDNGFIPAQFLRKGDNVISSARFKRMISGTPYTDGRPAKIADIVDSLSVSCGVPAKSVPVAAEYLHGDGAGCKGNVDIVRANGFLGRTSESSLSQHIESKRLRSGGQCIDLAGFGSEAQLIEGAALASDGSVSVSRDELALFRAKSLHPERVGLCGGSALDAAKFEPPENSRLADGECFAELYARFPGLVTLDNIVDVSVCKFSGHVYDLHCLGTAYHANGVLSSNCRGTMIFEE